MKIPKKQTDARIPWTFTRVDDKIKPGDVIGWPNIARTEATKVTEVNDAIVTIEDTTGKQRTYRFSELRSVGMVYRPDLKSKFEPYDDGLIIVDRFDGRIREDEGE